MRMLAKMEGGDKLFRIYNRLFCKNFTWGIYLADPHIHRGGGGDEDVGKDGAGRFQRGKSFSYKLMVWLLRKMTKKMEASEFQSFLHFWQDWTKWRSNRLYRYCSLRQSNCLNQECSLLTTLHCSRDVFSVWEKGRCLWTLLPLTKLEVVSSSTAIQFSGAWGRWCCWQWPPRWPPACLSAQLGRWTIGENRGGTAGQTEASLSVFTGASISQLPSILVTKERTEFYEEPTPIYLIVHDPS